MFACSSDGPGPGPDCREVVAASPCDQIRMRAWRQRRRLVVLRAGPARDRLHNARALCRRVASESVLARATAMRHRDQTPSRKARDLTVPGPEGRGLRLNLNSSLNCRAAGSGNSDKCGEPAVTTAAATAPCLLPGPSPVPSLSQRLGARSQ